jgi:sulfur carrier protein
MELTINGESRDIAEASTVEELLHVLQLDPRAVVVERNREIVRRPAVAVTPIAAGDVIEIVHFVGGG